MAIPVFHYSLLSSQWCQEWDTAQSCLMWNCFLRTLQVNSKRNSLAKDCVIKCCEAPGATQPAETCQHGKVKVKLTPSCLSCRSERITSNQELLSV
ncbi:hypothetical protein SRHO_G00033330 [Serrasalmus rhombeus]